MKISYFADREAAERGWGTFLRICFSVKVFFYIGMISTIGFLMYSSEELNRKILKTEEKIEEKYQETMRILFYNLEILHGNDVEKKNERIVKIKEINKIYEEFKKIDKK